MRFLTYVICGFLLLSSCQDDINQSYVNHERSNNSELLPMLSFESKKSLEKFVNSNDINKLSLKTRSTDGFVSMMATVEEGQKTGLEICRPIEGEALESAIQDGLTYYEMLGYYKLIPNEDIAATLNVNGEVMVNDTIYKVTSEGTYFFPSSSRVTATSIIKDLPEGQQVSEYTYLINDQIKRYDTFHGGVLEESVDKTRGLSQNINEDPDSSGGGSSSEGSTTQPTEPDYASFDTVSAGRHTWVGGAIDKLLGGPTKYHHRYYSSTKRLSARLYGYNYLFYSETGVSVKFQKLPWYQIWKRTRGDELRASWSNIVLEYDVKYPTTPSGVSEQNLQNYFYRGQDISTNSVNGNRQTYSVLYYFGDGLELTTKDLFEVGGKGTERIFKWLQSKIGNSKKPLVPYDSNYSLPTLNDQCQSSVPQNCILIIKGKAYIFIADDEKVKCDSKSLHRIFSSKLHFMVHLSFDSGDFWSSFKSDFSKNMMKSVEETLNQKVPRIVNGEAVVCGRRGATWKGLVIKIK